MNYSTAWTDLTGNLYSLTSNAFGDKDQQFNLMSKASNPLTGLVIDWRYVLPDNLANPTGPSHPILYASGTASVFRSLDKGTNWTQFPPISDGASAEGGYLPNVIVTDLDIVIGNIDPATGRANAASEVIDPNTGLKTTANGWNILVASTYGRGAYAIRLAPIIVDPSVFLSVTGRLSPYRVRVTVIGYIGLISVQKYFQKSVKIVGNPLGGCRYIWYLIYRR